MPFQETLEETQIRHLNLPSPNVLSPTISIRSAIKHMRKVKCACGLVVKNEKLIGIVTERDVMNKVVGRPEMVGRQIREIMTPNPVTLGPDNSLDDAIELMSRGGYRNVPIIDDENRAIASLNVHQILQFILENFPQDANNLPPRPEQQIPTPEGA
ncbi:MAG TPA: CBS domain-containing protein [Firmicutes bacterium]|nr:CBS domain-containing protein [Bacillota bacterium]